MLALLLNLIARASLARSLGVGTMRQLAVTAPPRGACNVVMTWLPGLSPREVKGRWPSGFA